MGKRGLHSMQKRRECNTRANNILFDDLFLNQESNGTIPEANMNVTKIKNYTQLHNGCFLLMTFNEIIKYCID